MSRRAVKAVNWSAIAERVPPHQKNLYAAFKAKSDQYLRRMMANPETTPQINWEYYRKNITIPGLVDKFKKEYESLKIPYPEDKYTSLVDAEEKNVVADIEKFRVECDSDIQKLTATIASLKAIMPYDQMTLEEFLEYHPEYIAGTAEKPSIWPHTPEMIEAEEVAKEAQVKDH
ncbi:hypothetical protein KPH14_011819 [Odynerus spinipes]|uniref:ATP synthase subunit d, mitochondrial n=1 Tax=Odynerus spinipes TaxID=1348599 RepID=A0AAD9RVP8_9HYME|nr:hypothetical protein KPH14_011819 [Odynerus spinipes]